MSLGAFDCPLVSLKRNRSPCVVIWCLQLLPGRRPGIVSEQVPWSVVGPCCFPCVPFPGSPPPRSAFLGEGASHHHRRRDVRHGRERGAGLWGELSRVLWAVGGGLAERCPVGGGQLDGLRGPVEAGAGVPRGWMLWAGPQKRSPGGCFQGETDRYPHWLSSVRYTARQGRPRPGTELSVGTAGVLRAPEPVDGLVAAEWTCLPDKQGREGRL